MKKAIAFLTAVLMTASLAGCGSSSSGTASSTAAASSTASVAASSTAEAASSEAAAESAVESTPAASSTVSSAASETSDLSGTVTLFAAKSLNTVMEELIAKYNETRPNVEIVGSYDSSGTLMTQIEEGAACDVFFSAAQKQMNELEDGGYLVDGTRHDVVNNQVCVVTYKDSGTKVTGLANIGDASSFALADGSVPVGKYTRQALVNAGMMDDYVKAQEEQGVAKEDIDVSQITTQEVSDALGGIEINECANVGAVTAAVSEGSNEVGTVYYSDTYGLEDKLDILEKVSYDLTGNVIYPVAQVNNAEADDAEKAAAEDFVDFLISDDAKAIFDKYYFDTNV